MSDPKKPDPKKPDPKEASGEHAPLATYQPKRAAFIAKAVKPEHLQAVEEAHEGFFGVLNDRTLSVATRTVVTGHAITALTKALDGAILDEIIMPLMNTAAGFDTDKNPAKHPSWSNNPPPEPYDKKVVLTCTVDALLMGLPLVGNRWNIIGGNMYPRKEGFEGLLMDYCRFTATADVPPVPKEIYLNGGYLQVPVRIQYRLHTDGEEEGNRRFNGSYKVRCNKKNAVGVEASEGKAKRKAYRDLFFEITGMLLPDADVDEGRAVFQVGAHHGEPQGSKTDGLAAKLGGDKKQGPPWEVISADAIAELKRCLGKQRKLNAATLAAAVGHEGLSLEELPREVFDNAMGLLG